MKLGIKVGPSQDSEADITAANPDFCEVWFDISRQADYRGLFSFLEKSGTEAGLHYWGALPDGTWTTLAHPDEGVRRQTVQLIRKTIDIAAEWKFTYVNIHPGARADVKIDFSTESFRVAGPPVELKQSIGAFLTLYAGLHDYATSRGVVLTVETVPARVYNGWYNGSNRLKPFEAFELPLEAVLAAASAGYWVANDFAHTAASLTAGSAADVWKALKIATNRMSPKTRLVHVGFLIPPFNGTDYHDRLDNPGFTGGGAVPDRNQTKLLLKQFVRRSDVWVLAEPASDHVGNFRLLKTLAADAMGPVKAAPAP
ncbi:hypothetical protein A2Z33_01245 [Candidatus Gottesmanbacteria bacterium RBG_16_52_11]|uniref:Xylose isomerase-like TIM barrel domain-containing protein n=1 Tax=Candidatus Gottesmanbacteria bacterium RBG_16_52_11 TaxID=1798374 RepID=A0A1F5YNT7_9BACT|nr:MAG: hypothetical protein A2Z33_01245 [Candidatus Gottesmanbacteria bacterium RBG_16_52_11]